MKSPAPWILFGAALCASTYLGYALLPRAVAAEDPAPTHERQAPEPREPTIQVAAMLAGTWSEHRPQAAGESYVEEIWSAPRGDNVIGSFRWLSPGGSAAMYEILVITQEADGIYLRLRHFGPDLTAREERDEPQTLRLAEYDARRLVFEAHAHCKDLAAVTYDRSAEDELAIEVAFVEARGRPPLRFRLRRGE